MALENIEVRDSERKNGRDISYKGRCRRAHGTIITEHQQLLAALNIQFPGERKKPYEERDPQYNQMREEIMGRLDRLTANQRLITTEIRALRR